jgi:RNA recognition motif-containing protein
MTEQEDKVEPQENKEEKQEENNNGEIHKEESNEEVASEDDSSESNIYDYVNQEQESTEHIESTLQPSDGSAISTNPDGTETRTWNIFVGDLRQDALEDDLRAAFEPCGPIHSVHIFRYPRCNNCT